MCTAHVTDFPVTLESNLLTFSPHICWTRGSWQSLHHVAARLHTHGAKKEAHSLRYRLFMQFMMYIVDLSPWSRMTGQEDDAGTARTREKEGRDKERVKERRKKRTDPLLRYLELRIIRNCWCHRCCSCPIVIGLAEKMVLSWSPEKSKAQVEGLKCPTGGSQKSTVIDYNIYNSYY